MVSSGLQEKGSLLNFRGGIRRPAEMSWLSPVQWAKWTWSAVTGGAGDDGQLGAKDEGEDK